MIYSAPFMRRSNNWIFMVSTILAMVLLIEVRPTSAFAVRPSVTSFIDTASSNSFLKQRAAATTTFGKSKPMTKKSSSLQMADIPNENTNKRKKKKVDWLRLPPTPEDQFTMIGDLLSLFVYGFTDHFLNDFYIAEVLDSSPSAEAAAKAIDPYGSVLHFGSLPVWMDTTSPSLSEQVLKLGLQQQLLPTYSPVLSTAGCAAVSLAACWLLAGYLNNAFHFRNTLDCSTHHAVRVTGKTWTWCCIFMLILACGSRYFLEGALPTGEIIMVDDPTAVLRTFLGTLTISDTDYIFNSLGVLLTWRVMISYLVGNWR